MEDFKFKIAGKNYTTKVVEEEGGSLLVTVNGKTYQVEMPGRTPAPKPVIRPAGGVAAAPVAAPAAAAPASDTTVVAPLPGTITKVVAKAGQKVKKGDVVVITHEGPKGGPGMQEMLYPTSYIKSMHMGKECALITDGRFSGGTSGLSIGHISPEAASGGNIGKVMDGDIIDIDIPNRSINVRLSDEELQQRPQQPLKRQRVVSKALRAYAQSVTSADKGGVRIID